MSTANNNLFTEIAPEESAHVAGGGRRRSGGGCTVPSPNCGGYEVQIGTVMHFNLDAYLFGLGAGVGFGNGGLTADEIQFSWENAIEYGPTVISV